MIPEFAVVGHPNKGKSSIVATLSEDQHIAIGPVPGTTYRADRFTLTVNGQALYTLVDTPGFQRPAAVLEWLETHQGDASERPATVASFVSAHTGNDLFHDECELLAPILEGAGILYVVDGAKPYGAEYELEMQILQWTGQPRMALINKIGPGDYVDQWRNALDQYFSIVRTFDAMHADFNTRINLLSGFAELDERWRAPLHEAVSVLTEERRRQLRRSANQIADLLASALRYHQEQTLAEDMADSAKQALERSLRSRLLAKVRKLESECRDAIQRIYRHQLTERREAELKLLDADLFAEETWEIFGLSRLQLIATGGVSGAVAGGGLDLLVGGSSLFAGAVGGALIGSLGAWLAGDELAKVKVLGQSLGGDILRVGPIKARNFPWVLLGRAYLHHALISERNHAQREAMSISVERSQDLFESLSAQERHHFDSLFDKLRKGEISHNVDELVERIEVLLGTPIDVDLADKGSAK